MSSPWATLQRHVVERRVRPEALADPLDFEAHDVTLTFRWSQTLAKSVTTASSTSSDETAKAAENR